MQAAFSLNHLIGCRCTVPPRGANPNRKRTSAGSAWRIAAIPTLFKAQPEQERAQMAVAIQLSLHKSSLHFDIPKCRLLSVGAAGVISAGWRAVRGAIRDNAYFAMLRRWCSKHRFRSDISGAEPCRRFRFDRFPKCRLPRASRQGQGRTGWIISWHTAFQIE